MINLMNWTRDTQGNYFHTDLFGESERFTPHEVLNYISDKNQDMLTFASKMNEYYKTNKCYPNFSFEDWIYARNTDIGKLKEAISPEYQFYNASGKDNAFKALLKLYDFEKSSGKINFEKNSDEFIRYIFDKTDEWCQGQYY